MRESLLALAGRASLLADPLREMLARRAPVRTAATSRPGEDKTGLVQDPDRPIDLLVDEPDLRIARYDSFAHTLWRAQELSLLYARRALLVAPSIDFGCGDGAFAAALGWPIAVGVDSDAEARAAAAARGTYERVVGLDELGRVPLDDGAARSIFANSVLEHVEDLPGVLRELRRLLAPGGRLLLTAPTPAYTAHLARYFGAREADRVNAESAHRNLLTPEQWQHALADAGFTTEERLEYQPPHFTYWYRMSRLLGRRGLARWLPELPDAIWRARRAAILSAIRTSIGGVVHGANVLIVARAERAQPGR